MKTQTDRALYISTKRATLHAVYCVCLSIALASCGGSNNPDDGTNGNPTDGGGAGGDAGNGGDTGDSGGDPTPIGSAAEFNDEFSVDSLSSWSLRHQTEGEAAQYTLLDINQTNPGMLTIRPALTPGWFADGDAPLIYKRVTGNFSVETSVLTSSTANPGMPPGNDYNSAGLMVRSTESQQENHIMVNVGRQASSITDSLGTEIKNTINSSSMLELQSGSHNGRLILCRVGSDFITYRQLDNETQWTELGRATRTDIPATAQVGMIVNGYTGPDIIASFDYVRMSVPATDAQCTDN